jgi:hypothetical protein
MKPQFLILPYLTKYLTIVADHHSMFSAKSKNNLRVINFNSVRCSKKIDLHDFGENNFYNQIYELKNHLNIASKAFNFEILIGLNSLSFFGERVA